MKAKQALFLVFTSTSIFICGFISGHAVCEQSTQKELTTLNIKKLKGECNG